MKSVDKGSVENNVTLALINHWVNCNVYTQSGKTIQRLMVILKKYKYLREYPKNKKNDTYWNIRNLLLHAETYLTSLGLRKEEKKTKYMERPNDRRRFTVLQKHVFSSADWVL